MASSSRASSFATTVWWETYSNWLPATAPTAQTNLALGEKEPAKSFETLLETSDGYRIEPWVVFVQALNHATEHRKQIAHLMRLLGVEPPRLDGWSFGEARDAVAPLSE